MVPKLKGEEKVPCTNSSSNSRPAPNDDTLPLWVDMFSEEEKGLDSAVSILGMSAGVLEVGGTSHWSIQVLVMRLSGFFITLCVFTFCVSKGFGRMVKGTKDVLEPFEVVQDS